MIEGSGLKEDATFDSARATHGAGKRRGGQLRCIRGVLIVTVMAASALAWSAPTGTEKLSEAERRHVLQRLDGLPLSFIENQGQSDPAVAYYLQRPGFQAYFAAKGVALRVTEREGERGWAYGLRIELVGASEKTAIEAVERAPGIVSYFTGSCEKWKTGIRTATEIAYRQPWPGVDVHYRGQEGKLEAVYMVAPGADPATIRLRYLGQDALKLDEAGNLALETPLGDIKFSAPVLYQDVAGHRVPVDGRFMLAGADTVGFQVAPYDHQHPLIIDPTLAYAGYIGGDNIDNAHSIAVDSTGAAYVAGYTTTTEATFPSAVGPDLAYNGGGDAFVVKVNPAGTALVYAGYIGGSGYDVAYGIAVDSTGAAYVAGVTGSTEATFPVVVGPDLTLNGGVDAFVAKVKPSGDGLFYAGYVGGGASDYAYGIAVDGTGAAYVAGNTGSTEATFPVAVGPDLTFNGDEDAFVAKVNPSGSALAYAGYIGGSGVDDGLGIAVDGTGAAYVAGATGSTEATFPVAAGPDLTSNGGEDAFVAKVNPSGTGLSYAGYIGGSSFDIASGVAVDSAGAAYVAGSTDSTEATFPVAVGPDLTFNGGRDAFVAKVSLSGTGLSYAGYIGGSSGDSASGVGVDGGGAAYLAGDTFSNESTFPVRGGPDLTHNGDLDAFVAKVNASGATLSFAGYVGGNGHDVAWAIAADSAGNAYVAGSTDSDQATFPVMVGPDLTYNGGATLEAEAFVAKLRVSGPVITSVISKTSKPGSKAKILGSGFLADPQKDIVYFGKYRAMVNSATSTRLDVTIPSKCKKGDLEVYVVVNRVPSNKVKFTIR